MRLYKEKEEIFLQVKKRIVSGVLVLAMLLSTVVNDTAFKRVKAQEVAVPDNMLVNGDLATDLTGWSNFSENATLTHEPYKAIFDIRENMADWQISLYQVVNAIETGSTYCISFDVLTSVDRTVIFGFDGSRDYTSKTIPAGVKTTVSCEVTASTQKFMIYLGTNVGAHRVEISNISLFPKPVDLPNDENDQTPDPITSLDGLKLTQGTVLKNGSFALGANGMEGWSTYAVDWMNTYNVVRYSKVANGVKVWITNVGDGAGNVPQDAKFYQNVKLAASKVYTISFDVHSEKARSIQISLDARNNILSKTIAIQKGETRHVSFNIPAQSSDTTAVFSVLMGSVGSREVRENNLTFSNMKLEINGFTRLVQLIDDGDFSNGIGTFTSQGNVIVDADREKSAKLTIGADGLLEDVSFNRGGLQIAANQSYDISFVAGARHNRDIRVVLEDALGEVIGQQDYTLTTDPVRYTMQVNTTKEIVGGTLRFMIGGVADTVYIDTIRMDATGYAQVQGVDLEAHDITELIKQKPPIISEDTDAVVGDNVTLTFPDDGTYQVGIDSITVNGEEVQGTNLCSVQAGKIVLDQSLFTIEAGKDRSIYEIVIQAPWYSETVIKQVIYPNRIWNLTWSDEFDGTGNNLDSNNLDLSKWSYQEGNGAEYNVAGWGNSELEYYTRDNIKVEDGTLKIEAKKEEKGGQPYTSGRIWTMADDKVTALFSQKYGKFEAKIKMPGKEGSQGLWPAFWMLPADTEYGSWPLSGEIDIMEARGREPDRVDGTIHFGQPYPNNQAIGDSYVWEEGKGSINDYHVYSLEWEPGELRWYVDGELYYTENNWYSLSDENPVDFAYPAPFDQEFYIILNLAVGGTYDGNLIPDDSVIPAEMLVDYVRAYEYTGEYEEPVKPTLPKEEIPAGAKVPNAQGDYIVDPQFNNVKIIKDYATTQDPKGWNFATLPDFGGTASFKKVEENGITLGEIDITNSGNAAYSIQLIQNIPLVKGRYYKISFDGKAEKNRELSIKFGDVGDDKWGVYGSYSPTLTKELEHYEYIFQMGSETDVTSRIEFNLGLNATSVWIGNVSFTEVDGIVIDDDCIKKPLKNGNHIYNGTFDLGNSRLVYWNLNQVDGKVNNNEVVLNTSANNMESLSQQGIELLQKDTYKLVFDGSSNVERDIKVRFSSADDSVIYDEQTVSLSTTMEKHAITFSMPAGITDKNGKVAFLVGGTSSVINIDNTILTRETNRNVDFSDINCYPLQNGDFEAGTTGWSTYGTNVSVVKEGENKVGKAVGAAGGQTYESMLMYSDLEVVSGFTYNFSFRAKANKAADISVAMEDEYYNRLFPGTTLHLTTEWQTFSYETKFNVDAVVTLKYLLAGTGSQLDFYIDDVVFEIKGAPKKSGTLTSKSDLNYVDSDLVFNSSGDKEWIQSAEFYVDGEQVEGSKISIVDSTVTLDKTLFKEARVYEILVKAEEYSNYHTTIKVYGHDKNLLLNGNFDYGLNSFETYAHQGCADFTVENGYLNIHSKYQALENNQPITWSVQLGQSKIPVVPGEEYILTFVGYSTVDRKVILEGINNKVVTITKTPQVYQIPFTPNTFDLSLKILMGTVEQTGDKEHNIYLANFGLYAKADYHATEITKPGEQLDAPLQVFAENASNGIALHILPALSTPSGVLYQIYINDKLVEQTESTTYLYETKLTGMCKIQVKVVKDGYKDSKVKEITIQLRDVFAPDIPNDFTVKSVAKGEVNISITPPYDNVGVAGYLIYLDGVEYANSSTAETKLKGITQGEHLISIRAYDIAGNKSGMTVGKLIYVAGETTGEGSQGGGSTGGNTNGGDSGQSGLNAIWSQVLETLKQINGNAKPTDIVALNDAIIPKEILVAMKDKPVRLLIDMNTYSWSINGESIKDVQMEKMYNLAVTELEEEQLTKLQQVINKAKKENKVDVLTVLKEFKINHNGALPFKGELNLPLDLKYANTYVYIYYWNEKLDKLELKDIVKVNKAGEVVIPFNHASSYIITEQALLQPSVSSKLTLYTKRQNSIAVNNVIKEAQITYKSSNSKIASVNKDGKVTGKKAGSATITVTIKQGGKKYVCKSKITVKTSVFKFNKKTSQLKVGKSFTFTLTNNGYPKDVVWSTTDPLIATITKSGKLTAVKTGTVTVCATVEGNTIVWKVKIIK